jgi:hypothetical protein
VKVTGIVLITNAPPVEVGSLQVSPSLVATALTTAPLVSITSGIAHTGVWSVGMLPSSVQRICAPAVEVVIDTLAGPSKDPELGRMVGGAALTVNTLELVTVLSSKPGFVAKALMMTFVDVSRMAPLYTGEAEVGAVPSRV